MARCLFTFADTVTGALCQLACGGEGDRVEESVTGYIGQKRRKEEKVRKVKVNEYLNGYK